MSALKAEKAPVVPERQPLSPRGESKGLFGRNVASGMDQGSSAPAVYTGKGRAGVFSKLLGREPTFEHVVCLIGVVDVGFRSYRY